MMRYDPTLRYDDAIQSDELGDDGNQNGCMRERRLVLFVGDSALAAERRLVLLVVSSALVAAIKYIVMESRRPIDGSVNRKLKRRAYKRTGRN